MQWLKIVEAMYKANLIADFIDSINVVAVSVDHDGVCVSIDYV